MSSAVKVAAIAIFAATYLVIAVGKLPGLRLDRAGAALVGAALMLAAGVLSVDEAAQAVDLGTLALLLGLMIVVANLRLAGVFRLVNSWMVAGARHPLPLLAAVTLSAGILSAFLLNDAICLVMTPLVLDLTRRLQRRPLPYLLAVAMAANVGSTATITGNPQNILVAGFSQIGYREFAAHLAPVAGAGLVATMVLIALMHPGEFFTRSRMPETRVPVHLHKPLAAKAVLVTALMMAALFAGQAPAKAALVAGGVLLLTRVVRSERIHAAIDWPLLLLFAGLFVVVAGFEKSVLTPPVMQAIAGLHLDRAPVLTLVTAVLSNLVSNVPAVLVLKPVLAGAPDPHRAWLIVAMASTLAGNFTILGSVANLIVVQGARAGGVAIGFWSYFRVGAPLTILTILFGLWWLAG
ncbi:MAG TPA: anion transporter [Stellaceae bacterium]|nr:anion transporter [Stellaceae bacterium]